MALRWWKERRTAVVPVCMVGAVCFCCPGMFNALNGLGAGGQEDPKAADDGLTALYATFAVFGILGGGIRNVMGTRPTLFVGCCLYVLYVGSYLYYNHHEQDDDGGGGGGGEGVIIGAGALLGVGAGLLWAAQGAVLTSYPPPDNKGLFFSLFWSIFNLGAVVGALVPFALTYHSPQLNRVNDQTYVVFMIIMSFGAILSLAVLPPAPDLAAPPDGGSANIAASNTVVLVHVNGSAAAAAPSFLYLCASELAAVLRLFLDWRMLLLAPACFASNFFYSYQFNSVNAALFNIRTRALNNAVYWAAQMAGSAAIGWILDRSYPIRRTRGLAACAVVAATSLVVWGGGLANQLHYSRTSKAAALDFRGGGRRYGVPLALYASYGLLDAMFQTLCYWAIGAIASDERVLSRYSGFYKGVQSAGAAVAWHLDTTGLSYLGELILNWALMVAALPLLALLLARAVATEAERKVVAAPPPSVAARNSGTFSMAAVTTKNNERETKSIGIIYQHDDEQGCRGLEKESGHPSIHDPSVNPSSIHP